MDQTIYRIKTQWSAACQRIEESNSSNGTGRWLLRKTIIRLFTAHLALIGLALFAAAIRPWEENFVHTKGVKGDWQDAVPVAPLALSFLYNIFHTIYVFSRAKPLPAAVNGIVDFLVWAVLVPGIMFAAWGGTFRLWRQPVVESSGEMFCDIAQNMFSIECFPALYRIGTLELGGIVFGILVWIMTTFLFVHGCIEAVRLRREGNYKTGYPDPERARSWESFTKRRLRTKDEISPPPMARIQPTGMPRYR